MAEQPKTEPKFRFEPLASTRDRAVFSCRKEVLDSYLHNQARQDVKKHAAVLFVMTSDDKTIAGFYALSQYSVRLDDVPADVASKRPKYPNVSATLLGPLAITKPFQGQDLGRLLLMDALYRCLKGSKELASAGVIVDAKDAVRFLQEVPLY